MSAVARSCELCGSPFSVAYPSIRKRFCTRSCAVKSHIRNDGRRNPNWRGGKTSHPLYDIYLDMLGRCRRRTHHAYARYGGRGITVCGRWQESFWHFVEDVGERPEGHSMDRIDNDGPYGPENFRWATASEQMKNRRPSAYTGLRHNPSTGRFEAAQ
jgi:hypothetical protein